MSRLEISTQEISDNRVGSAEAAPSRPLHELAGMAPHYAFGDFVPYPAFPFSNDECAAQQFSEAALRQNSEDYQAASNRVALIVGESSLAACLKWIPEETIIMLDVLDDMCEFMSDYSIWLQYASSLDDWRSHVLKDNQSVHGLESQLRRWQQLGQAHALASEVSFQETQEIARQKVFVPWSADLTDADAMRELADELKKYEAHITFINLTNVIQYNELQQNMAGFVDSLRQLPVTKYAPILTTSTRSTSPNDTGLASTGPFFGLDNLAGDGARRAGRYGIAAVEKRFSLL